MKTTIVKLIPIFITLIFSSCDTSESTFKTNQEDYEPYLATKTVKTTSKYFELWNSKIKPDSLQLLSLGNVASEYNRFFKSTGDVQYLKKAEECLQRAVEIATVGKSGYLRALARNYISQHRFKEALVLAKEARELGSGLNETQSLLFDLHMELGDYTLANQYLDSIKNLSDFGYLIRVAKWNDHKGDLDTAIQFMEKAKQKAESSNNQGLKQWSYTNLADFYGHAGRISDSYNMYLQALKIDPQNAYAKKGIAWIVYSHERNGEEALRILDEVMQNHEAPENYLLQAEIASYLNKDILQLQALDDYFKKTNSSNDYGSMYNAYNVDFYINADIKNRAYQLAQEEVRNRPTPESYSLLAYSLLHLGKEEKAMELIDAHVANATFEPALLQMAAEIYKANGKTEKVSKLKKELLEATFELGPVKEATIAAL
ncbi:tetratricopeptide repeat protein [Flagellimonas zhangzhouensis]|uniref:Tetratricopeptide repeat-containing protein n=1 Tax=Flagellimonas zhangzhouensis TaxID=1073328 RepID=A0A1H2RMY6_9FLAO|nr:hypothetical protein [Allomuricauda zhangzhouensis]SDQ65139.1 Tetratricopeptide repeat-containing protein [Allomuricauda zhangzhouensis]SDW20124.1 Tetratricopeptide repeat-containing protein [Allomuricauda zhangzhouensis]